VSKELRNLLILCINKKKINHEGYEEHKVRRKKIFFFINLRELTSGILGTGRVLSTGILGAGRGKLNQNKNEDLKWL
jgi:hypothetical protein